MALRKAIITVMLSALLVSSTAVPIYAVDDTESSVDTVTDEMELEEEDEESDPWGNEESELSEESEESEEQESIMQESELSEKSEESEEQSQVSEQSQESEDSVESGVSQEQSKEESKTKEQTEESSKQESIKDESSNTEIKTGKQKIKCHVNFNCDYLSNTSNDQRIDFSGVNMTLLSADKKSVIKTFDMKKIMYGSYIVGGYDLGEIEVPEWGHDGDKYILRFENLPDIYTSSTQDLPIICQVRESDIDGKTKVTGIDDRIEVGLNVKDYNVAIFIYDMEQNIAKRVNFKYYIETDDEKVLLKGEANTGNSGCGIFKVKLDDKDIGEWYKLRIVVHNSFNGNIVSSDMLFDYMYMGDSDCCYSIEADGTTKEIYTDENGKAAVGVTDIDVKGQFMDKNDMILFKYTDVQLMSYYANNLFDTININKNKVNERFFGLSEGKYTLIGKSEDYDLDISPRTLDVNKTDSIIVKATPKLSLIVINEEDGVRKNARFKVVGYENTYNEMEHKFSVNHAETYRVVNLETNEEYSVFINEYKETILNIANGEISVNGYVGENITPNNINNTSSGSNISPTDVYSVPKTGDIVFSIIMILTGITGLSYLGYMYFKRKGIKHNEAKK